jgi:hypothetical protein
MPDPLSMQHIQEFSIKRGVIFTQTRLISGVVWTVWGNGGAYMPGLERGFKERQEGFLF